jgi:hypothetical protein
VCRAWFALLFRSRHLLHVKNWPKSVRGFFRLQKQQYCSCGLSWVSCSSCGLLTGAIELSRVSWLSCGPSQASLTSVKPSFTSRGHSQALLALASTLLPVLSPAEFSLSSCGPSQASLAPIELSLSSRGPSRASLLPVEPSLSSRGLSQASFSPGKPPQLSCKPVEFPSQLSSPYEPSTKPSSIRTPPYKYSPSSGPSQPSYRLI